VTHPAGAVFLRLTSFELLLDGLNNPFRERFSLLGRRDFSVSVHVVGHDLDIDGSHSIPPLPLLPQVP
jgi:hypothetical protein